MSNSDLPGSYWQDQDAAGYAARRSARLASAGRDDSRDAGAGGRHSQYRNEYGPANGWSGRSAADGRSSGNGHSRGNGHARRTGAGDGPQTWTAMIAGRARGSHSQRQRRDQWGEGNGEPNTGWFSQTADDLRRKFGMRGSGDGGRDRAWPGTAASGWGGPGGRDGSRTALRERDNYGQDGERTSWLTGSRTAARLRSGMGGFGRGGGSGWGGGSGRGGGGRFDGRGPRNAGERVKLYLRSGDWWRHWTVKKVLGLVGCCVAGFILLLVGAFFIAYANTKIPTASELTANWQSSTVYYANGEQMGTFDNSVNGQSVDRLLLTSSQVPAVMAQAMAAAEDRHFYTEGGVSLSGLVRAAYQDLFGHGNLQGGSTITMQYAKNYYQGVNGGQNLTTKLKEIIIAMKLGHERSKPWVMTNYLNLVPFGGPSDTGLGAAALNYFNVNLTNPGTTLTPAQAAMLAAMPNSPGFFNPDPSAGAGYRALVARWHYVLNNMVRDGAITQKVANEQTFPKITPPASGNGWSGYTGYLMSMVEQQLEAPASVGGYGLTRQQVDTGGYRIHTTFRPAMVNALARAVNQEKAAMRAAGEPFRSYDRIGAVLEDPKTGGILAVYGGPGYGSPYCNVTDCQFNYAEAAVSVGSSFKPYVLSEAVNQGMNVFTSQLNGFSPIYIPVLNSPVNYTQLETTPSATTPPPGVPKNAANASTYASGNTYYFTFSEPGENSGKPLPVNVAAAISSDPAFEDLAHRDGVQNVINMAKAFGVGQNAFVMSCRASASAATQAQIIGDCNDMTGPDNGLQVNFGTREGGATPSRKDTGGSVAIALGQNPLTPVEQATTFATLADDGLYHTPHVIAWLQQNNTTLPNHITATQVLSPAAAADVDYALSFDNNMAGGTAEANVSFRRGGVIGKTGTLGTGQNSSEAWFIGATPSQAALSVALFTNLQTQTLNAMASVGGMPGSQGGGWPATIWNAFMTQVYGNTQPAPMFPTVNGGTFVTWLQAQPQKPGACRNLRQWLQSQQQGQSSQCTCPNGAFWCSGGTGTGGQPGGHGNGNGGPIPTPSQCVVLCTTPPTPTPSASTAALVYGDVPTGSGTSPPLTGRLILAARQAFAAGTTVVT